MLKMSLPRPGKGPQSIAALCGILFTGIAIIAQTPETTYSLADLGSKALGVSGLISLVVGVGWGLINRKTYDKLKETISDLEDAAEAKDTLIESVRHQASDLQIKLQVQIATLEKKKETLKASNDALASQYLQMKGILKELRVTGKWDGHEESINH